MQRAWNLVWSRRRCSTTRRLPRSSLGLCGPSRRRRRRRAETRTTEGGEGLGARCVCGGTLCAQRAGQAGSSAPPCTMKFYFEMKNPDLLDTPCCRRPAPSAGHAPPPWCLVPLSCRGAGGAEPSGGACLARSSALMSASRLAPAASSNSWVGFVRRVRGAQSQGAPPPGALAARCALRPPTCRVSVGGGRLPFLRRGGPRSALRCPAAFSGSRPARGARGISASRASALRLRCVEAKRQQPRSNRWRLHLPLQRSAPVLPPCNRS